MPADGSYRPVVGRSGISSEACAGLCSRDFRWPSRLMGAARPFSGLCGRLAVLPAGAILHSPFPSANPTIRHLLPRSFCCTTPRQCLTKRVTISSCQRRTGSIVDQPRPSMPGALRTSPVRYIRKGPKGSWEYEVTSSCLPTSTQRQGRYTGIYLQNCAYARDTRPRRRRLHNVSRMI
ncbi:hypothetical protein B0I35DRAFT_172635 [Stachybotrys elegans]|uniref:Uncharacterized protein n=1 Tax=Stachybotrys elegans TaxID=80388 RepID=A0A8K0SY50_9HYPO|nr:hypothetical protein B0I35DRAFT_172635 [Stachybotrys elegans]